MLAQPRDRTAFTLIELLTTIAIMAVLVVAALFFTASYVQYSQQTADKQTYTVLNDALTRYKCEGGNINALTLGAPIGHVISALQTPVNWCGLTHQFLQSAVTYRGRSLFAVGVGSQYHFYQYNTYTGETLATGTPTSQYQYGQGVGYMSNGGSQAYTNLTITTSSGYYDLKDASGTVTKYTSGLHTIPATSSFTFWSCDSSGATATGNITAVAAAGPSVGLTALDVSGLTALQTLDCSSSSVASLNITLNSQLTTLNCSFTSISSLDLSKSQLLTSLNCSYTHLSSLDVSGATSLQTLLCNNSIVGISSLKFGSNPALSYINAGGNWGLSFVNLAGCTGITGLHCAGTAMTQTSAATLNALYSSLPPESSAILYVGTSPAAGSNTSLVPSGWTVSFTF